MNKLNEGASVFSKVDKSLYIAENSKAFAIRSKYEVSLGHSLIIPNHIGLICPSTSKCR
jgi:diadenosine tetraphosphate (Ap4A) HIT family hydrolase